MNTETTTGEYMLLFRGPHWDRGLAPEERQQAKDELTAWFDGLRERGKIKAARPLGVHGRIISGINKQLVLDGPFAAVKEAVGGLLVLLAADLKEAVEVARSMPALRYGIAVEVRPILAEFPIFESHIVGRAENDRWEAMAAA